MDKFVRVLLLVIAASFLSGEAGIYLFEGLRGWTVMGIDVGLLLMFSMTVLGGLIVTVYSAKTWDDTRGGM